MIGIKWVMERYVVAADKPSGILDDPNLYEKEKFIFTYCFP